MWIAVGLLLGLLLGGVPVTAASGDTIKGHVILFEHVNLHGAHKHVFNSESNLAAHDDDFFNDRVSSIAVLSGTWRFYMHSNYIGQYAATLGPGIYRNVGSLGFDNDAISSLQAVSAPPSVVGEEILGHAVLFEHASLRGAHKHVFNRESDLAASDDNFFNDRVSSIVIQSGDWRFFRHVSYGTPYAHVLGPGIYQWVKYYDIENDDMSSMKVVSESASRIGGWIRGQSVLFEHRYLRGAHKHVFNYEPNLAASDDNFFNDRVSSLVALSGDWKLCRHANFEGMYPYALSSGIYQWLEDIGVTNDDISSLILQ